MTTFDIYKQKEEQKILDREVEGYYTIEDKLLADMMSYVRNCCQWLRDFIFHVENEGNSSSPEARRLGAVALAKGKLAGVPDLICLYGNRIFCIELKLPGKGWGKSQKDLLPKWINAGIRVETIDNFTDFLRIIEEIKNYG